MEKRKASLPNWATVIAPGKIEADAEKFYPELIQELVDAGLNIDQENLDQYWLEVVFQMMKLDIQMSVIGTDAAPPEGGALIIMVNDVSKKKNAGVSLWAQKDKPAGKGAKAATKGMEAKENWRKIRGGLI